MKAKFEQMNLDNTKLKFINLSIIENTAGFQEQIELCISYLVGS